MSTWNDLSIREKAGFIKIGVDNGLTSLSDIQSAYNKFAEGGAFGNKQVRKFSGEEDDNPTQQMPTSTSFTGQDIEEYNKIIQKYEANKGKGLIDIGDGRSIDPAYLTMQQELNALRLGINNRAVEKAEPYHSINLEGIDNKGLDVTSRSFVGPDFERWAAERYKRMNWDRERVSGINRDYNELKLMGRMDEDILDSNGNLTQHPIHDKPLELISPEFDLITMGSVGKDLFKFGKNLLSLRRMPVSYTGVPNKKVPTFMKYNPKEHFGDSFPKESGIESSTYIYASSDPQTAFGHLKKDLRNGKIFKLYNKKTPKEIHIKSPQKEFGVTDPDVSYSYGNMPFEVEEGKLVKTPLDQWALKEGSAEFQEGYKGYLYGPETQDLLQQLRPKGYNKIRIDGVKLGYDPDPRITEYIYATDKDIIKAPLEESMWQTALRIGNINPSSIAANGTLGTVNILSDYLKALGGHIYDGETEDNQQMSTPVTNYQYFGGTPSILEQMAELEFYKQHGYEPNLEEYGYRNGNTNQDYSVPTYPYVDDINEELGTNIQTIPVAEASRLARQGYDITSWQPELSVIGSWNKVKNLDLSDPDNPRILTPFDQNYILPEYSQTWIDENVPYWLAKQFDRRELPETPTSTLRLGEETLQKLYPNATRADILREDARFDEATAKAAEVELATLSALAGNEVLPLVDAATGSALAASTRAAAGVAGNFAKNTARSAIDPGWLADRIATGLGADTYGIDLITGMPKTIFGATTTAGTYANAGMAGLLGSEALWDIGNSIYNTDWGQGVINTFADNISQNWNSPEWYEGGINNTLALLPFLGVPAAGAGKLKDWYRYYKMQKKALAVKNIFLGLPLVAPAALMQKSKWYRRPGSRYDRKFKVLKALHQKINQEIAADLKAFPYFLSSKALNDVPLKYGDDSVLEVFPGVKSIDVPFGGRPAEEVAKDLFKEKGLAILDTDNITIYSDGAIGITREGNPFNLEQGEGDIVTLQEFGTDKFHAFHLVPGQSAKTAEGFYGRKEADIPEELTQLLEHNSNYIKSLFPKEMQGEIFDFGSAVLTQQKLLGKVPHDIDFLITREAADSLPQLKKASFNGNGFTKTINIPIDKQGHTASIDFNIIETDAHGNITGKLADELITQFFPDVMSARYMNEARKLLGIPTQKVPGVSLDELLQRYDPVKKSIIDSLETNFLCSNKEKHRHRIFKMMNAEGSSDILQEGIRGFGRRMLGEHCMFAPKLDWSDVKANKEFLKKTKLPLDFADNPEKMQSLFELWYLDQTTMYRIISSSTMKSLISHPTEDDLINAFNVWISKGGNAYGFGLNATLSGISDHGGDIAVFKQLPIDLSGISSPLKALERMEMGLGRNYAVTAEDLAEMPTVAQYLKPGDNLRDLLRRAPSNDIQLGGQLFDELNSRLGTVALHNADITYGAGRYISVRDNTARGSEQFTNQLRSRDRNAVQSLEQRLKSQENILYGNSNQNSYHSPLEIWANKSKTTLYTNNTKMHHKKELIKMIPKDTWNYSISEICKGMKRYNGTTLSRSEIKRILENPDLIDNMPTRIENALFHGIDAALIELNSMSDPKIVKKRIKSEDLDWKLLYYGNEDMSASDFIPALTLDAGVLGILAGVGYSIYKAASGTKKENKKEKEIKAEKE